MHYHYQHVNTLLRSFYHYLMVSFVRQRNNLMEKKNTDHYLSIYAYFFIPTKWLLYLKLAFLQKITGIFCYRRKETSFHC